MEVYMRTLVMPFAFVAFIAAGIPHAFAQRGIHIGYCHAGTCAQNGSSLATNVRNCKREHCAASKSTPVPSTKKKR